MARLKFSRIVDLVFGAGSISVGVYLLVTGWWPDNWIWPAVLIVTGILEMLFDTGALVARLQKWILRLNVKRSDR